MFAAREHPVIPVAEFAQRRSNLLRSLKGSIGVVFAGDGDANLHHEWRPHPHFEYLTGVRDEAGAVVLVDPTNPVESRQVILFLRPLNPELERWDGYRETISSRLRDRYGIQTIMRTTAMPRFVTEAAKRSKRLACLHPFASYVAPVSPDLALFRQICERIPGCAIEDRTALLAEMRARKSAAEVLVMRRAMEISARGYEAALATIRPGISEFDVQEAMEHAYKTHGARSTAYRTIAGTGFNATVLHYHANSATLADGDLICIDSGAAYEGYSADVTRTYPVSGTFSKRQREVYAIVLDSLAAGIRAAKAGVTLMDIDKACRDVITRRGYGDHFIHGAGHHLGLETHDISPDAPLADGAVITIEPGIYIPDERLGIRIEDDVLVGKSRSTVLTDMIPKGLDDIERLMAAAKARSGTPRAPARPRRSTPSPAAASRSDRG